MAKKKTVHVKSHPRKGLKKKKQVKSHKRTSRPKGKKKIVTKQRVCYNLIRNEHGEFLGVTKIKRKK